MVEVPSSDVGGAVLRAAAVEDPEFRCAHLHSGNLVGEREKMAGMQASSGKDMGPTTQVGRALLLEGAWQAGPVIVGI